MSHREENNSFEICDLLVQFGRSCGECDWCNQDDSSAATSNRVIRTLTDSELDEQLEDICQEAFGLSASEAKVFFLQGSLPETDLTSEVVALFNFRCGVKADRCVEDEVLPPIGKSKLPLDAFEVEHVRDYIFHMARGLFGRSVDLYIVGCELHIKLDSKDFIIKRWDDLPNLRGSWTLLEGVDGRYQSIGVPCSNPFWKVRIVLNHVFSQEYDSLFARYYSNS